MAPETPPVPVGPIAVGCLFLGLGLWFATREWRFLRTAHRVHGTMVENSTTRVTFRTLDGTDITAESRISVAVLRTPLTEWSGPTVRVLYAPDDPYDIRLHGAIGTFLIPALIACFLGVLAVVGSLAVWLVLAGGLGTA